MKGKNFDLITVYTSPLLLFYYKQLFINYMFFQKQIVNVFIIDSTCINHHVIDARRGRNIQNFGQMSFEAKKLPDI